MKEIFEEISEERKRQTKKHGTQWHVPSVDKTLLLRKGGCEPERMCEEFEIPSEERAKFLCNTAFKRGDLTMAHIVVEELSEAVSAKTDHERRKELVQLAACVVQWIETIDRKKAICFDLSQDGFKACVKRFKELQKELPKNEMWLVRSEHEYSNGYWIEFYQPQLSFYDDILVTHNVKKKKK